MSHVGVYEVYSTIENYQSFISEIQRLQNVSGTKNDFLDGSLRKQRNIERAITLEKRIGLLNRAIEKASLTDIQEAIVDCRLSDMTMVDIALHFRKSRQTIYVQFDEAVEKIANAMK